MILATCLGLVAVACASTAGETADEPAAPRASATAAVEPSPTDAPVPTPTASPRSAPTPGPTPLPTPIGAQPLDAAMYPPKGGASDFVRMSPFCGTVSGGFFASTRGRADWADLVVIAEVAAVGEGLATVDVDEPDEYSTFVLLQLDEIVVLEGEPPAGPLLVEVQICDSIPENEFGANHGPVLAEQASDHVPADLPAIWFLSRSGYRSGSEFDAVIHPDSPWDGEAPIYSPFTAGVVYIDESGYLSRTTYDFERPLRGPDPALDLVEWITTELALPADPIDCRDEDEIEIYLRDAAYSEETMAEIREVLDQPCVGERFLQETLAEYPQTLADFFYDCPELTIAYPDSQRRYESSTEALEALVAPWHEAFDGSWVQGGGRLVMTQAQDYHRIVEAWAVETPEGWVIDRYQHCLGVSP